MTRIGPLETLSESDYRALVVGYQSNEEYAVEKTQDPAHFAIGLRRRALSKPFVKRWMFDAEEFSKYRGYLAHGHSFGAWDGDRLVGLSIAERQDWNRSLWVWEFHIAATHHKQGIGRRLMDATAARAAEADLRVLICETQNTNVPAMDFYRRLGFEIDGIHLSYYPPAEVAPNEIAVFMKRSLAAP